MESLILEYIQRRMAGIGYPSYVFEPVVAVIGDAQKELAIEASNEYYFLVSKELPAGAEIVADNEYFKAGDHYSRLEFARTVAFTGQIKLGCQGWKCGQSVVFEFIRVIPQ